MHDVLALVLLLLVMVVVVAAEVVAGGKQAGRRAGEGVMAVVMWPGMHLEWRRHGVA